MNTRKRLTLIAIVAMFAILVNISKGTNDSIETTSIVAGYGNEVFEIGSKIYASDFSDHANWIIQIEESENLPSEERISYSGGVLDLYMPAKGCTVWLNKKLTGAITIVYQVRCPMETINGTSIQARDINNFWHCSDPFEFDALLRTSETRYKGNFSSYHEMRGYYASTGGGGRVGNQTTRFRRYPRRAGGENIPHAALNDKDANPDYLITPGIWHTIQLVAYDGLVQYLMDGTVVYEIRYGDDINVESEKSGKKSTTVKPYRRETFPAYNSGYFGIRMVASHHQYRDLKVYRLNPK